jgi:hypothetical protein
MYYDELLARLRAYAPRGSYDGERAEAAAAIECLMREVATRNVAMNTLAKEGDALQADLAAARALLRDVRTYVPTHPYPDEKAVIDRIDAALAGKDAPKS